MRFALFLYPGAVPMCGLVMIWPLAVLLPNGMLHEVPQVVKDHNGRTMLMQQQRVSFMGLN